MCYAYILYIHISVYKICVFILNYNYIYVCIQHKLFICHYDSHLACLRNASSPVIKSHTVSLSCSLNSPTPSQHGF